jgi:hypothetical protein
VDTGELILSLSELETESLHVPTTQL